MADKKISALTAVADADIGGDDLFTSLTTLAVASKQKDDNCSTF